MMSLFGCTNSSSGQFLNDIDLNEGNYALYVRHKQHGEFMVLDQKALKQNQDKLNIKGSFINYLPGEGNRGFGVMLFKDNQLVKSKTGGVFRVFDIGDLAAHRLPVKQHHMQSPKRQIQNKYKDLTQDQNMFITLKSSFYKDEKEFSFRVSFPSIAIDVKRDSTTLRITQYNTAFGTYNDLDWPRKGEVELNRYWEAKIATCIRHKAKVIGLTDFNVGVSSGSLSNAYLFNAKTGGDLDTKNRRLLYTDDFIFYDFTARIRATKSVAQQLLALDYSDCVSETDRHRPAVLRKMQALLDVNSLPYNVLQSEVGLSGYKDNTKKSTGLYEQEYSLRWLEVTTTD